MNTRRITLGLGAAAGGLLATAFLSTAVALADDFTTDAGSTLEVLSQDGFPPYYDEATGVQLLNIVDTTQSITGTDVVGHTTPK
jgi:hypothetical protein